MSQEKGDVAKKVAKKGGEPREVKSREKREDTPARKSSSVSEKARAFKLLGIY